MHRNPRTKPIALPTLTREFQRLMSTGALPPDALDGLVPDDDASDGDTELGKPAADDEEDEE